MKRTTADNAISTVRDGRAGPEGCPRPKEILGYRPGEGVLRGLCLPRFGYRSRPTFDRVRKLGVVFAFFTLLSGCGIPKPNPDTEAPVSFVQTTEPSWFSVEVRPDLSYTVAWESAVDSLIRTFDIEILSKEDGYLRTSWSYGWGGALRNNYRVRIIFKFSTDREQLDVKSEAEYLTVAGYTGYSILGQGQSQGGGWVSGTDTRLLSTMKSDLLGKIGRRVK